MTDCARIEELISALVDGELDAEDEKTVKEHIRACPSCAAMYEAFALVSERMEDTLCDVPEGFKDKVMRAVEEQAPARKRRGLLTALRPYMTAAACLVVLVGVVSAVRGGFGGADTSDESLSNSSALESHNTSTSSASQSAGQSYENSIGDGTDNTAENAIVGYDDRAAEDSANNADGAKATPGDGDMNGPGDGGEPEDSRVSEGKCGGVVVDIAVSVVNEGGRKGRGYISIELPDGSGEQFWLAEGYSVPDGIGVGSRVVIAFETEDGTGLRVAVSVELEE